MATELPGKEETFDGIRVRVQMLPAMKAYLLLPRYAVALGHAASKLGQVSDLLDASVGAMGAATMALFEKLTPAELDSITRELMSTATIDGEAFDKAVDLKFRGKILTLLKVVRFAFEVNYGDFLDVVRGFLKESAEKAPSQSSSSE
jgi:hypothetical protein